MGTKAGTVTDWLSSEFAGGGEDVGGSPRRLLVDLSGGQLGGGGWRGSFPPQLSYFLGGGEEGNSGPAEKRRRGRTRKGFPSAMEPRIAESVSRASDTQGSPRGTGIVNAEIAPQLFFVSPSKPSQSRTYFNRIQKPQLCTAIIVFPPFFSPCFKIHAAKTDSRVVKQLTLIGC